MKNGLLILGMALLFFVGCKKEDNPGANEVFIRDYAYTPATLTVSAGTTVTWTNKESVTHTVTSDSTALFNSADLSNGKTFSFVFTTAGTFKYHCNYHPEMHGTVVVH